MVCGVINSALKRQGSPRDFTLRGSWNAALFLVCCAMLAQTLEADRRNGTAWRNSEWCSTPPAVHHGARAALITAIFGAAPHEAWCEASVCKQYIHPEQLARFLWWHTHFGFSKVHLLVFHNASLPPPQIEDVYPASASCIPFWHSKGWLIWLPTPLRPSAEERNSSIEAASSSIKKGGPLQTNWMVHHARAIASLYARIQFDFEWIGVCDTDELIYANVPTTGHYSPLSIALADSAYGRMASASIIMPVHIWDKPHWRPPNSEFSLLPTFRCRWPNAYHCPEAEPSFPRSEEHFMRVAASGKYDMIAFEWKTVHRTGLYNLSGKFAFHVPPPSLAIRGDLRLLARRSMFEPHGLRVAHLAIPRAGPLSRPSAPISRQPIDRLANDTVLQRLRQALQARAKSAG